MKKIIIGIIIGVIISCTVGVLASTIISSTNVIYQDKTVNNALDELYNEVTTGKELVAAAITNKGITTTSADSYETMANNINNINVQNTKWKFLGSTKGKSKISISEDANELYIEVSNGVNDKFIFNIPIIALKSDYELYDSGYSYSNGNMGIAQIAVSKSSVYLNLFIFISSDITNSAIMNVYYN